MNAARRLISGMGDSVNELKSSSAARTGALPPSSEPCRGSALLCRLDPSWKAATVSCLLHVRGYTASGSSRLVMSGRPVWKLFDGGLRGERMLRARASAGILLDTSLKQLVQRPVSTARAVCSEAIGMASWDAGPGSSAEVARYLVRYSSRNLRPLELG